MRIISTAASACTYRRRCSLAATTDPDWHSLMSNVSVRPALLDRVPLRLARAV